jgi:hypothetical protein
VPGDAQKQANDDELSQSKRPPMCGVHDATVRVLPFRSSVRRIPRRSRATVNDGRVSSDRGSASKLTAIHAVLFTYLVEVNRLLDRIADLRPMKPEVAEFVNPWRLIVIYLSGMALTFRGESRLRPQSRYRTARGTRPPSGGRLQCGTAEKRRALCDYRVLSKRRIRVASQSWMVVK